MDVDGEDISTVLKKMIMEESGLDILSCLRPDDLAASTEYAREAGLIPQYIMDDLKIMHSSISHELRCRYLMLYISKRIREGDRPGHGNMFGKFIDLFCRNLNMDQVKQCFSQYSHDKSYVCNDDRNIQTYTSCGMTLKENDFETAILLEVRVKFPSAVSLDHKWYKNGEPLKCDDSVFNTSILCVRLQDILAEGEYKCKCTVGKKEIESETIGIKVETLLCKYKTQLSARYKSQPQVHVEEHAWPDVQQDTYINLAVIGGKGRMSNKCYQQTIRGDADDVLSGSKANIEYRQAFQDINHGDRVLVVGRPGSGKTTLVHRVSQDWAHGSILGLVKALFLIYLRGFHSNQGVSLKSLVKCYFRNEEDVDAVCKYIEEHEGLGVCFILDGLDEYQPEMDKYTPNFIVQLIRGDVLPRAVVIVASRPAAVASFTKVARRHVEVLGFFKQQVEEYINSYEFNSDLKQSTLKKYLEHHPNVHHMCYLPIQSAMICFLFDVCEDTLPNTETGIYTEFTKQTVLRALYRRIASGHKTVPSLEHLDKKEKDVVFLLCKLAFEMTRSSKQVIHQEEVKAILKAGKIEESLGLITVDRKATVCGFQNIYSFCHLTFQEFLAAYHISRLEVQEQLAIIQSCGPMKHMYMIFKFYCGLVKFEEDCGRFKKLLEVAKLETLHKLHCCFESQQPATCDFVTDRGMIVVNKSFRTPSDYTCLGYVVVNAMKTIVKMMEFDESASLNEECLEAFIKATNGTRRTATPVELLSFAGEFSEQHLELMRACPSLLVFQWYCPGDMVIDCKSTVSHPSLEIVGFNGRSDNLITSDFKELMKNTKQRFPNVRNIGVWGDGASAIQKRSNPPFCPFYSVYCQPISSFSNGDFRRAEVLAISYEMRSTHFCYHNEEGEEHRECLCTHLYIFNCNINNPTAVLLTEGVKYNIRFKVLKLVANSIGDEGAVAIADSIKCCSSLHWLDLSLNRIGDEGAAALVSSLNSRSNFKLHLFGNCISDSIIARVCSKNNRELLQTLDIIDCIGDVGLACIDSLVKEWTPPLSTVKTLHTLYLQSCNNSPDGIKCVASILSRFTSLQSVSLIDMNICDEGVRLLSGSLQWRCISVLILSHNKIGDDGAWTIAHALRGCEVLSVLDLSGNGIQDAGTEAPRSCKLQRLGLASNCIGDDGARAVAHALRGCEVLSVLDLSGNGIHDAGAEALSDALRSCCKLQRFSLASNCIGDDGARAVAHALRGCELLSVLDLSGNSIQDAGTEALSEALKCCKLQRFSLASNSIGPSGALAGVLKHVYISLDILDLSCNRLGDVGIVGLVGGLKHCSCLKQLHAIATCNQLATLNLSDNEIGDSGALCLGKYLKDCNCLHTLRLNNNLISGCGAVGVAEGVKHCKYLHTLEIGWNCIFLKDINTMVCILKECANLRRLFVAKHVCIEYDQFMNAKLLRICDFLPQCDIIVETWIDGRQTCSEINYDKFSKMRRIL